MTCLAQVRRMRSVVADIHRQIDAACGRRRSIAKASRSCRQACAGRYPQRCMDIHREFRCCRRIDRINEEPASTDDRVFPVKLARRVTRIGSDEVTLADWDNRSGCGYLPRMARSFGSDRRAWNDRVLNDRPIRRCGATAQSSHEGCRCRASSLDRCPGSAPSSASRGAPWSGRAPPGRRRSPRGSGAPAPA